MSANTKAQLATCRTGRVILHVLCLLQHPEHLRWHWSGILRELRPRSV